MQNEIVGKLVETVNSRIDNSTREELQADMKKLVVNLVSFVGGEDSRILDKTTDPKDKERYFFKMIAGLVTQGLTAAISPSTKKKLDEKMELLKQIFPLFDKYSQ